MQRLLTQFKDIHQKRADIMEGMKWVFGTI